MVCAQSFWLAETLKYLYLLFSPDEVRLPFPPLPLLSIADFAPTAEKYISRFSLVSLSFWWLALT